MDILPPAILTVIHMHTRARENMEMATTHQDSDQTTSHPSCSGGRIEDWEKQEIPG